MTTNADQGTPQPDVAGSRTAQILPELGRPQVVVIGGGFGGLAAVHGLRDTDVDVTLIDRHTYNIFQPLLYQVATATLNAGDITWFLRSIRAHQHNVWLRKGTVLSIDHASRTIAIDSEQEIR
jgi:NADH:ubiquinone reductase (H+-translocating)